MNNLGQGFNLNDLPQDDFGGDFKTIPAGDYQASITESELRDTRAGTGQYISVRFDILGPSHAGRVLYTNLNIRNPNPDAERIGQQQLGELMRAIGLSSVTDTSQLIGHNLIIRVARNKESNEQYADADGYRNEVRGFKSSTGSAAPMQQATAPQQATTMPQQATSQPAQQPQAQPQQTATPATPPWAR